jgi:nucleoid-associated protein YgaU
MPTCKSPLMAVASALALACGLLGLAPSAAQDEPGTAPAGATAEATPAAAPATTPAAAPAARPAPHRTPSPESAPTAPPRNLKLVGNHWTPYNPPDPESFPPDSTLHIIVPGETLWGLADLTYNNPYLWPQLWDKNRYITDSHWIYPGDPLLVPPRPVVVTQAGENAGVPAEIVPQGQEGAPPTELGDLQAPDAAPEPLAAAPSAPVAGTPKSTGRSGAYPGGTSESGALVDLDEVRCAGYIAEDDKRHDLYIAENDEPVYEGVTVGSLLYLNKGKDDPRMVTGARFSIVEREGTVLHPETGDTLGNYYRRNGEVTVLKVLADTAIAAVSFACDEIRVGDALVPIDAKPVPVRALPPFDALGVEPNGKATGVVIHARDTKVNVAAGDVVQIDLGSEDGLQPGDFLTAFANVRADRKHWMPPYDFKYGNEIFSLPDLHQDDGREIYPQLPVAQLIVVSAGEHTATAKIVHSVREITIGSMVEIN